MSLRPAEIAPVPAATVQFARAAFPKRCPAMRMRDELGAIYDDQMFAAAYPARGQPAHPSWRLALVTVLQFAEGLSDRQAAHAVRGRIDWKYALGLELADPGFDFSILCEFRARLIAGGVEPTLLDAMLGRFRERGVFVAGFFFSVVPDGKAHIRTQMSAALNEAGVEFAIDAFKDAGRALGIV